MPGGVPVATVALNGAKNAGLLAAQILGTTNQTLAKKLDDYKNDLKLKVEKDAAELQSKGWRNV
jgi:5-(carboxyamino)imidazole ribonucleotide mutase